MTMQFMLDSVLVVMGIALLGYGIRFSRRLEAFRSARIDMAAILGQLNQSVARAERAIVELRQGIDESESGFGGRYADMRRLADELALMTEAGEGLARRLEVAGRRPQEVAPEKPVGVTAHPRVIRAAANPATPLARQIAALEAMRRKAAA